MNLLYLGANSGTSLHRFNAMTRLGHTARLIEPESFVPSGKLAAKFHYETGGKFCHKAVGAKILAQLGEEEFDLVWVDGGRYVGPNLIRDLRKRAKAILNYNHDDPFGKRDRASWLTYLAAVPAYDLVAVVRVENIREAKDRGARRVEHVYRSSDEVAHAPREITADERAKWGSEVVFVGTALDDRAKFMTTLLSLGVPLSIFGNMWDRRKEWPLLEPAWKGPGTTRDDEYSAAILASKIPLGLLSARNRDLHTTRSLEIPAMGALFCAERTSEHLYLYEEDEEAIFWSTAEECAQKCNDLLKDDERRSRIAAAGHQRALANGHTNEKTIAKLMRIALGDEG